MATLNLAFALALMLAVWNFAPAERPILIEVIDPQARQVHFLRLEPDPNGFAILDQQQDGWMQTGELGYDRSQRAVFHFGGRGVSPPLDLAAALPAFADVTNPDRADVSFRAELDGQVAELRQIRSGKVVTLFDASTSRVFILHAED